MLSNISFKFFHSQKQVTIVLEHFSNFDEHFYDLYAHLYCTFTVQYTGKHENTIFGKTERSMAKAHFIGWIGGRNLRPPIIELLFGHFKHEAFREPVHVPPYGFLQSFGLQLYSSARSLSNMTF